MKKTIVVFILALAIITNSFSQTEAEFTVGLTEDGEGVVIKEYKGREVQVRIPATIEGMPVKVIGGMAFFRLYDMGRIYGTVEITSVVIPAGVTIIGNEAFKGQNKLTSVTIPNSVTTLGSSVFRGCTNLETIVIPNNITSIGDYAFSESGLKSFTWPSKIQSVTGFARCIKLQTVIIPEGVTKIGDYAFSQCYALTSVTLPSTIEEIGYAAFSSCTALRTIVIPDTVENINFYIDGRSSSFYDCSSLTLASQSALKKRGYTGSF